MQQVTTTEPWNYLHFWNDPGTYILENQAAAVCISQSSDAEVTTLDMETFAGKFNPFTVKDGETFLIVRPGAFGDLLMLTPTIRALRDQFPLCPITVACAESYMSALRGTVGMVRYPLSLEEFEKYDHVIWMENVLENNETARETHGVQMFAERASQILTRGRELDYVVTPQEREEVLSQIPRTPGKPRIAIQCRASTPTRTYDTANWEKVIRRLWQKNCEIFLIGSPLEIDGFVEDTAVKDIHNMTQVPLSFRQSAAVVASSDLLICVDSAMMHVAGAIGVPTISLHGAFPAEIRTPNLKGNVPISGDCSQCAIAPCQYHQKGSQLFPAGQVCEEKGHCVVIDSILPGQIVKQASDILNLGKEKR